MIKFLADASLNEAIASGVIRAGPEPSIDFLSANAMHLEGVGDAEVLALAAREGRILVTQRIWTKLASSRRTRKPVFRPSSGKGWPSFAPASREES